MQEFLQQALDERRAGCAPLSLLMHRHHRYRHFIMTGYGEVLLRISVFLCGRCRETCSGMALLGDEEHYRRSLEEPVILQTSWGPVIELPTGRQVGRHCEEQPVPLGESESIGRNGVGGEMLKLHGIWTRFRSGPAELNVMPDDSGMVLGHLEYWEEAKD